MIIRSHNFFWQVLVSHCLSLGITMWEVLSFGDKPFGSIGKRIIKKKLGEQGIPLDEPFDYLDTKADKIKSREFKDLYDEIMW